MDEDKSGAIQDQGDPLNEELEAAAAGESPAGAGTNIPDIHQPLPGETPATPEAPAEGGAGTPAKVEPEEGSPAEEQPLSKRLERNFDRMLGRDQPGAEPPAADTRTP